MEAIMKRQAEPNNKIFFAGYEDRFKKLKELTEEVANDLAEFESNHSSDEPDKNAASSYSSIKQDAKLNSISIAKTSNFKQMASFGPS